MLSDEEVRTDSPIAVAEGVARHAEVAARLALAFGERNSYREVFDSNPDRTTLRFAQHQR